MVAGDAHLTLRHGLVDWENDPASASKVVDENGEPMVVYHGTGSDFNVFDKKLATDKEGREALVWYR